MLIELKIHREGGSLVTVEDQDYLFEPDKQGRHVATVTNPAHQKVLLAIDAYVEVDKPARKTKPESKAE